MMGEVIIERSLVWGAELVEGADVGGAKVQLLGLSVVVPVGAPVLESMTSLPATNTLSMFLSSPWKRVQSTSANHPCTG